MRNWQQEATDNFHVMFKDFPPKLKQAMFAAAKRQVIHRRTWDGCALNAAGFEVGTLKNVESLETAAEAFNIPQTLVAKFINYWDSLPGHDEECTELLRNSLLKAGLFTEAGKHKHLSRIVSEKIWEQQMDEFNNSFDNFQIPDEDVALSILDGSLAGV